MHKAILSLFFVLAAAGCQTQTEEQKKFIIENDEGKRLDSLLTPYVEQLRRHTNNDAGLAIGVTKGNQIIYLRTFGYADIERSIEANMNTVFHIASVSKPFAATAVMKLAEQGKVELDDPVIDYIPEFEMKGDEYKQISIRHILTHTSGIPRNISTGDWENPVYGMEAEKKTMADVKELELDFSPGSMFSYSNSAFDILGIAISRAAGVPYEEFVEKQILHPSGMTHSYFTKPKDSLPPNWAVPHSYGLQTQEWSPYPYSENFFPSSGLQTTILDMCQWGMLHVHWGKVDGGTVVDESYFSQLTEPHFDTPWGDKIGLSWFLQSYVDRPIVMHQGNDTGFESIVYIYPEDSISITVMANRDFSRTARIINAVSEVLFDEKKKEYTVSGKYKFADVYHEHGIERAKKAWEDLRRDTTDIYYVDNEDLLTTGAVLENGKEWKPSKEILEYYISFDSSSTYAWRLLGNTNLQLGDLQEAQKCYERCLEINPNYEKGKEALEELLKIKK